MLRFGFARIGLGPGAFLLSIVGGFGTVIALQFLREKSPLNLGLLYAFATFEGMLLGLILDAYVAQGLGGVVLNAAGTTAAEWAAFERQIVTTDLYFEYTIPPAS